MDTHRSFGLVIMSSAKPVLAPLRTKRSASPLATADGNVRTPVKREECLPLWSASLDRERFSECALPSPSEIMGRDTKEFDHTPQVTEKYKAFLDAWESKYDKLATPSSASSPTSHPASAVNRSFNFNEEAKSPSDAPTDSLPPPTPMSATSTSSKRYRYSLHFPPSPLPTSNQGAISRSATPRSATYPRVRYSESMTPWSATPRSATGPFSTRVTYQTVTHTVTYKRTNLEAPPKTKRRKHQEESDQKTE